MEVGENISVSGEATEHAVSEVIVECINNVVAVTRSSGKATATCCLCKGDVVVESLDDVFAMYGKLLDCVTFHLSDVSSVPFVDLFILDSYILSLIADKRNHCVEDTISERDMDDNHVLTARLVRTASAFFTESNIKIYCEQKLESLFYKFYKRAGDQFTANKHCNLLLWVLFKRKESNRFFTLYSTLERKNVFIYKLALLFTLQGDCLKESSQLLNEIERKFCAEDLDGTVLPPCCAKGNGSPLPAGSSHLEKCKEYQAMVAEINATLGSAVSDFEDLRKWHEKMKDEVNWSSCLEMWSKNRADGTGLVDEAMISICIEHKKFDEGWTIYTNSTQQEACVSRAAFLCLKALKYNGDLKWIERIFEVVRLAVVRQMKSACCEITNNTVQVISNISEEKRKIILKGLIDNMQSISGDEEVVCCFLKAFLILCTKCKSSGTCEMCVEYANKFYDAWKVSKEKTRSFFFGNKTGWEKKIYCNMLGVCTETENCKGFYSVCSDVLSNDMEIDQETFGRLEKYHQEKHKNCKCVDMRIDTKRLGMGLLKHFLSDMK